LSEHLTATLCLPVSPAYAPVNAMSGASGIRCDSDLQRYNTLLAHSEVKRVRDKIQRIEEKRDGPGTRRHLLATSVRLSRSMAGDLHKMADHCVERLAINTPLELYAYASPQSNAACFRPEDGRVFIMFSSHLLENFDPAELMFVMGHELGHHVYQHHNIPIGYIVRGKAPPAADLALQLFTWSRYAEISADRAGAYCADDLHSVARALFKLASGITGEGVVKFDMKAFMGQVDEMVAPDGRPGQDAPMQDWFSTHPFSPLRVKALKQFHESSLMQDGGFDKTELEQRVQQVMQLMEPGYLEGKSRSARAMRDLFIAGAILIAEADRGITEKERAVLKGFLGEAYAIDKLDSTRLATLLPQRITDVKNETAFSQRMQVIRDLCLVASADKPVATGEVLVLNRIAEGLEVPLSFVEQSLDIPSDLD